MRELVSPDSHAFVELRVELSLFCLASELECKVDCSNPCSKPSRITSLHSSDGKEENNGYNTVVMTEPQTLDKSKGKNHL